MKILERHIAESITNKEKLEAIKKDLREANKKFIETEKCLDELKTDLEKTIIIQIFWDMQIFLIKNVSSPIRR